MLRLSVNWNSILHLCLVNLRMYILLRENLVFSLRNRSSATLSRGVRPRRSFPRIGKVESFLDFVTRFVPVSRRGRVLALPGTGESCHRFHSVSPYLAPFRLSV